MFINTFFLQNPDVPIPSQVDKDFFRKVYILLCQIRFLEFSCVNKAC